MSRRVSRAGAGIRGKRSWRGPRFHSRRRWCWVRALLTGEGSSGLAVAGVGLNIDGGFVGIEGGGIDIHVAA